MARTRDLTALAGNIRWAYLAVNAALPLPFATAGVTMAEAGPAEDHLMQLREAAFTMALAELLGHGYTADLVDLAELENGRLPALQPREER